MNHRRIGIRSVAVSFPSVLRTNDYFRKRSPDILAGAARTSLAKAFSVRDAHSSDTDLDPWTKAMKPYCMDPFRGTVERRVLGPGESSITLEIDAAEAALAAAGAAAGDIDLLLVASMFPAQPGPGNAALLARTMGMRCAAWNLNATCSGALVGIETAVALLEGQRYENALVAASATYSRYGDDRDALSVTFGDGAGAVLLGRCEGGAELLGAKTLDSGSSWGLFYVDQVVDSNGMTREFIRATREAGQKSPEIVAEYLRQCSHGALADAGVDIGQIKLVAGFMATAWYANFMASVLGIEPGRIVDLYPKYGLNSVASVIAHLHHAAHAGRLAPGDLVLAYSHGFSGSSTALVLRWGDVKLGPLPPPPAAVE